jgi:zinc transport system substrate-binding protein
MPPMRAASLALIALLLRAAPAAAEPPRVVASIKPVHALVAAVMEGIGVPALLVPGNASPHLYSLRPSDAQRLAEAQLVFWIGPVHEAFLAKPLAALGDGARAVTLAEAPGVTLLRAREGGVWEGGAHDHASERRGHDSAEEDGHLWLDPGNAKAIVAAAARALAAADPANGARYRANAARTQEALSALDARLGALLAPVKTVPYLVFHDAYQYLERRYGLAAAGAITVAPERKPGARRVKEIRARIAAAGVACVFAEPQFEPGLVRTLVEGTGARTGVLDPLGADLAEGPGLYAAMMERLAGALARCLAAR